MADVTIDYTNGIVLQVNEATRTITNGGKDTPIILGVKGDDCAERIYFEIPKQLSSSITDVTKHGDDESTIVYVNFKNAMHDTYIEECILIQDDETKAVFYWEITNNATEAKGDVKFNICVKRSVKDTESGEFILQNEWHTTMFTGKVLDSVDVSRTSPTPEVIVHDTITFQTLNEYAAAYNTWSETLANMNNFVSSEVDYEVAAKMVNYLPLAGGSMTGSINMANSNGLLFNNGSFTSDQNGHPIISSKNGAILFIGDDEYIPSWFVFPSGGGTLATEDYVNEITAVLEDGVYTTEVDGIVTAATKTSYFNGAIGLVDSSNNTYLLELPLKNGKVVVSQNGSINCDTLSTSGNINIASDNERLDGNGFGDDVDIDATYYSEGIKVKNAITDAEYNLYFPPYKSGTLAIAPTVYEIYGYTPSILSVSDLNDGQIEKKEINIQYEESKHIPVNGDKIKVYIAGTNDRPTYNTGVIEFELYDSSVDKANLNDDTALVGRGCYMSTIGRNTVIISAEFFHVGQPSSLLISQYVLIGESNTAASGDIDLIKVEVIKHS